MKDGLIVCALVLVGAKMIAAYRAEIQKFAATT
jgi:hypothetical protein